MLLHKSLNRLYVTFSCRYICLVLIVLLKIRAALALIGTTKGSS